MNNNQANEPKEVRCKIFKAVNPNSTMDVTSMLSGLPAYKKNKDREWVYRGRLCFAITDKKNGYAKAYIKKQELKPILDLIKTHMFPKFYGTGIKFDIGYHKNGGSNENGVITARVLSIFFTDRKQYLFQITEGPGKENDKGGYTLADSRSPKNIRVQKFLSYEEALQFAHEVHDYIRDEETKGMIIGKPLYTILPKFESVNRTGTNG